MDLMYPQMDSPSPYEFRSRRNSRTATLLYSFPIWSSTTGVARGRCRIDRQNREIAKVSGKPGRADRAKQTSESSLEGLGPGELGWWKELADLPLRAHRASTGRHAHDVHP